MKNEGFLTEMCFRLNFLTRYRNNARTELELSVFDAIGPSSCAEKRNNMLTYATLTACPASPTANRDHNAARPYLLHPAARSLH